MEVDTGTRQVKRGGETVELTNVDYEVTLLIDGKETDTLAGHVDLRNPLSRNMTWVKTDNPS